jgi:hypothetical protein
MSRFYHIDIARHAAGSDTKWLDNLLSHFQVPGVDGGTPGAARRITTGGVYHIVLIRLLARDLGLGVADAVALASRILSSNGASFAISSELELRFNRSAFAQRVDRAIADAVESVVPARRGRPVKDARRPLA